MPFPGTCSQSWRSCFPVTVISLAPINSKILTGLDVSYIGSLNPCESARASRTDGSPGPPASLSPRTRSGGLIARGHPRPQPQDSCPRGVTGLLASHPHPEPLPPPPCTLGGHQTHRRTPCSGPAPWWGAEGGLRVPVSPSWWPGWPRKEA